MNRTIAEIRKDLNAKIAEAKGIDEKDTEAVQKATEELRTLTDELNLAQEIEMAEQRAADQKISQLESAHGRKFSFQKFLREAAEGNLTGLEAEVVALGAQEYKRMGFSAKGYVLPSSFLRSAGQNAGTAVDGGNMKEVMPVRYIDGLKERLVVEKLGATVLGDLVGTLPVVSAGAISAAWKAEGATTAVSKSNIARVELTPHRASVVAAFSRDLLAQTSVDVENMLYNKVLDAHATLIEEAAIKGDGTNNAPTGILHTTGIGSVAMGTNGAALTYAKAIELETVVNANNGNRGKLGYLTNAKVIGQMKSTEKSSGSGKFIYEQPYGQFNGYAIDWTNLVPSDGTKGTGTGLSSMIFGNFEDLYIGMWAGIDVVVDPYTLAADGDVRIVLNAYNDVKVVEPKSFAAIVDIKA